MSAFSVESLFFRFFTALNIFISFGRYGFSIDNNPFLARRLRFLFHHQQTSDGCGCAVGDACAPVVRDFVA